MKLIVAGLSKTGTKSMVRALETLGYNVYDYLENFEYLFDEWKKIMYSGGTTDDFRRMYENIDAVTDVPACYYWDEIHKAFPDAKIILTVRDNEDEWLKSMDLQVKASHQLKFKLMYALSQTYRKYSYFGVQLMWSTVYGIPYIVGPLQNMELNEMNMKMVYRRHIANVLQNAPKDKLLVFNVKNGWQPLCKFLDAVVPNKPFPRRNVKGSISEEFYATSSTFIRCKREMRQNSALCVALLSIFLIYLCWNCL